MNQWILALALAIVAFLVYKLWKPMLKAPKAKLQPNEARIYFFYTDWCGFSQKAMPEWEKLERRALHVKEPMERPTLNRFKSTVRRIELSAPCTESIPILPLYWKPKTESTTSINDPHWQV